MFEQMRQAAAGFAKVFGELPLDGTGMAAITA